MTYSKRTLFIGSIALASAVLYKIFPSNNIFQDLVAMTMFLVIVPFLCIHIVLKEKQSLFGITIGKWKVGTFFGVLSLLSIVVFFMLLVRFSGNDFEYNMPQIVQNDFFVFVLYSMLIGMYAMIYSYFLHGFVVNGLRTEIGFLSIIFSVVIFIILSDISLSFSDAYVGMFLAAATAYYSRSIYYSFVFLFLASLIINSITLILLR